MVHGRVVWPPSYGAKLRNIDAKVAERLPGVLKIVRDGSYLAVETTAPRVRSQTALLEIAKTTTEPPAGTCRFA